MRTIQLPLNKSGIVSLISKAMTLAPPTCCALERGAMHAAQACAEAGPRRRGPFERLDDWLWAKEQHDVEAYLAGATDLYDLEARQRALKRNIPHPYY